MFALHTHTHLHPSLCCYCSGVKMELLKQLGMAVTTLPDSFQAHKQIRKVYEGRRAMIESGECRGGVLRNGWSVQRTRPAQDKLGM